MLYFEYKQNLTFFHLKYKIIIKKLLNGFDFFFLTNCLFKYNLMNLKKLKKQLMIEFTCCFLIGFSIYLVENINKSNKGFKNSFAIFSIMFICNYIAYNKSGAHFNSLITFMMIISRRLENFKGILYILT